MRRYRGAGASFSPCLLLLLCTCMVFFPVASAQQTSRTQLSDRKDVEISKLDPNARTDPPPKLPTCGISDYPIGIHLGPNYLTSSYYTAEHDPIMLAKVPATEIWRNWAVHFAKHGIPSEQESGTLETILSSKICGDIKPAFKEAMERIANSTAAALGRSFEIGYVVVPPVPAESCFYLDLMNEVMREHFTLSPSASAPEWTVDKFMEHGVAVQYAYDLTWPKELSLRPAFTKRQPWRPDTDSLYKRVSSMYQAYILTFNFEREFLEIVSTELCRRYADPGCDLLPDIVATMFSLGEDNFWSRPAEAEVTTSPAPRVFDEAEFGRRVEDKVQELRDGYVHMPRLDEVRGVVLTGGASPEAMKAMKRVLKFALPSWWDEEKFRTSMEPAFVPSLGAAVRVHREWLEKAVE